MSNIKKLLSIIKRKTSPCAESTPDDKDASQPAGVRPIVLDLSDYPSAAAAEEELADVLINVKVRRPTPKRPTSILIRVVDTDAEVNGNIDMYPEPEDDLFDHPDDPKPGHPDPRAAFRVFLKGVVVQNRSRELSTERIWKRWAAIHRTSNTHKVIAGIKRAHVAPDFRKMFNAPPAHRKRVDGRVQYLWTGYSLVNEN